MVTETDQGVFLLAAIEKVKFRRQVRPGEEVRMVIQNLRTGKTMLRQAGKAYVGDELAVEAEWLCMVRAVTSSQAP